MRTLKRGLLLSLEGIDGSGKSTLASSLAQSLHECGLPVVLTKEPGSTSLGKKLRTILQEQTIPVCSKAEFLLFAADRAQHFEELIIPSLAQNKLIISDRMADSSLVYQGYGRGLDRDILTTINTWAMAGYAPDITIYVRIDEQLSAQRILQRKKALTAFEKNNEEFTQKLVYGFDKLFATRTNVITLDGAQEADVVAAQALEAVMAWLTKGDILKNKSDTTNNKTAEKIR